MCVGCQLGIDNAKKFHENFSANKGLIAHTSESINYVRDSINRGKQAIENYAARAANSAKSMYGGTVNNGMVYGTN